jgi:hypothetical protein
MFTFSVLPSISLFLNSQKCAVLFFAPQAQYYKTYVCIIVIGKANYYIFFSYETILFVAQFDQHSSLSQNSVNYINIDNIRSGIKRCFLILGD